MALVTRSLILGPFATNAYVLTCDATNEAAIVDVGFDPERVADWVEKEGWRVRHLLNTHAHYDHAAAMRELQDRVGGRYWLHPGDLPLLHGLTLQGAAFGLPPATGPEEVNELADGQTIPLGRETLSVLHTPGHSPGSVTFRWDGVLWVGDVLFSGSVGRTDLPGGSFEALRSSIRDRLFPLGDEFRVLPGHGPETTIGAERRSNPFVGDATELA
jgi:hydroxyacylglutathione hydrolase